MPARDSPPGERVYPRAPPGERASKSARDSRRHGPAAAAPGALPPREEATSRRTWRSKSARDSRSRAAISAIISSILASTSEGKSARDTGPSFPVTARFRLRCRHRVCRARSAGRKRSGSSARRCLAWRPRRFVRHSLPHVLCRFPVLGSGSYLQPHSPHRGRSLPRPLAIPPCRGCRGAPHQPSRSRGRSAAGGGSQDRRGVGAHSGPPQHEMDGLQRRAEDREGGTPFPSPTPRPP